jgi:hypothetical protein
VRPGRFASQRVRWPRLHCHRPQRHGEIQRDPGAPAPAPERTCWVAPRTHRPWAGWFASQWRVCPIRVPGLRFTTRAPPMKTRSACLRDRSCPPSVPAVRRPPGADPPSPWPDGPATLPSLRASSDPLVLLPRRRAHRPTHGAGIRSASQAMRDELGPMARWPWPSRCHRETVVLPLLSPASEKLRLSRQPPG